jgi:amino acid transporter
MSTVSHQIGWKTAAAIVVSNMIGTGIFTTLGFQLSDITNTYSIFLLWIIGGILALFGAFAMPNWDPILKETEAILFISKKPIIHCSDI